MSVTILSIRDWCVFTPQNCQQVGFYQHLFSRTWQAIYVVLQLEPMVAEQGPIIQYMQPFPPFFTTIFTTTRLFFSKHLWTLCNTLPSIMPYMGSVWCYRNWFERRNKDGAKLSRKFALASHILTSKKLQSRWCCKNTSRLADICKEISTFLQNYWNTRSVDYPMRPMVSVRLISWIS